MSHQMSLFDLLPREQSTDETDSWVAAVNAAARKVDAVHRENIAEWGVHPSAATPEQDPDLAKAMDEFVRVASGGKYQKYKEIPYIAPSPRTATNMPQVRFPLKRGTKVCARYDITFADDTRIEAGRMGKIVTSGQLACNVHFDGYDKNHLILCSWDMLLEVVKS